MENYNSMWFYLLPIHLRFSILCFVESSNIKSSPNQTKLPFDCNGFLNSISVLIKVTVGFVSVLILVSYFTYLVFQREFKCSLLIVVSGILSFLASWGLLFQNLNHVFSFIQSQCLYIFNNNDCCSLPTKQLVDNGVGFYSVFYSFNSCKKKNSYFAI